MQDFIPLWLPDLDEAGAILRLGNMITDLGISLTDDMLKSVQAVDRGQAARQVFVRLYREKLIYPASPMNTQPPFSRQWFLKTRELAPPAIQAIQKDRVVIMPRKWTRKILDQLSGLSDWCLSQPKTGEYTIPVYSCRSCGLLLVEEKRPALCPNCGSDQVIPEEAGIDPWFVSCLWPFIALEKRQEPGDFSALYPVQFLVAGAESLYPWVTWMIMLGFQLGQDVPFREILVVGPIKRTGQDLDQTGLTGLYGSDALRFSLASQAGIEKTATLSRARLKGIKGFITKIRNASRFVILNRPLDGSAAIDPRGLTVPDRWILHALSNTTDKVNNLMERGCLSETAEILYHFFWHEYCNWYLEFSRLDLDNTQTRRVLVFSLKTLLALLYPFMPKVTQEIYRELTGGERPLPETEFPVLNSRLVFYDEFLTIDILKKIIVETRKLRTESQVPPRAKIPIQLQSESPKEKKLIAGQLRYFERLTGSSGTEIVLEPARGFKGACRNWQIILPLIDEGERLAALDRLNRERQVTAGRITDLETRLSDRNSQGVAGAVQTTQMKKLLLKYLGQKERLEKAIGNLS